MAETPEQITNEVDKELLRSMFDLVNKAITEKKVKPVVMFTILMALAAYVFRIGYDNPTARRFKEVLAKGSEPLYNVIRDRRN